MANLKDLIVNGNARVVGTLYGNVDNADKLDGYHAQAANGANTIPIRDANGAITCAKFITTSGIQLY